MSQESCFEIPTLIVVIWQFLLSNWVIIAPHALKVDFRAVFFRQITLWLMYCPQALLRGNGHVVRKMLWNTLIVATWQFLPSNCVIVAPHALKVDFFSSSNYTLINVLSTSFVEREWPVTFDRSISSSVSKSIPLVQWVGTPEHRDTGICPDHVLADR